MFTISPKIYFRFVDKLKEVESLLVQIVNIRPITIGLYPTNPVLCQKLNAHASDLLMTLQNKDAIEYSHYNLQLINLLDSNILSAYVKNPKDDEAVRATFNNLRLMCAATDNLSGMEVYSYDEFHEIIQYVDKDFEEVRFIHTLRECLKDKNRIVDADYIINFFQDSDFEVVENSFYDLLVWTLYLDIAWLSCSFLAKEEKEFLVKNYFYRSVVAGVPVQQNISDALYNTSSIIEYAFVCGELVGFLDTSDEEVPVNTEGTNFQKLTELYTKYSAAVKKETDGSRFFRDIYGTQTNRDAYAHWLQETLYVYYKLKEDKLIERNMGGEKGPAEKYYEQMVPLVSLFLDKNKWPELVKYFVKPEAKISIGVFLGQLVMNFDLEKENAVQKVLDFTDVLKKGGVLKQDQEIIEFYQDENKFKWSSWII